jgi:ubiquinone/menaquinone biosynthesis C-methylase UbiE/DNA-binding HxlR family transcriptional regulator
MQISLYLHLSMQEGSNTPTTGDLDTVLTGLRAAGEPTRLRILVALTDGELTVSELCRVLGQTQPRVSRHLRLLCEAGLLTRHSEGTNAFYAHTRTEPGRSLLANLLTLVDTDDRTVEADRQRLATIREERADAATRYFEEIAERWDQVRSLHVDDAEVEAALVAMAEQRIGGPRFGRLLDIGTGTGRVLELLADRVDHGIGIDLSPTMLKVARSNLSAAGLGHCAVRQGNVYALEVPHQSIDLAIIHHVLHHLEDPAAAIAEAALTLRPGGHLIVVDFAPHSLESLRSEHAHRRLGFHDAEIADWFRHAGLADLGVQHLIPGASHGGDAEPDELLTVGLWAARHPMITDTQPPKRALEPASGSRQETTRESR